jgi:hypothetical protein
VQRAKQARDDLKQLPSLCAVLYQLAMLPFTVASALFVFWWVLGMIFNESPDFWGPVIKPLVGFAFIVILMAPYWLSAILIWFLIERRWVQFEEIDWIAKLPLVFRKILGMVVSLGIYVEARFRRNVFRID